MWKPSENVDSLVASLRALRGTDAPDPDTLTVLLGLGSALYAAADCPPRLWQGLGRDRALPALAPRISLTLRGLHPPAAAQGLHTSAEFRLHFEDSYEPLIARALACGQTALAWRGWPADADNDWGVIVELRDGRPLGFSPGCPPAGWAMCGPAHQVYVVEDAQPAAALEPQALLQAARAAARAHGQPCEFAAVGAAAITLLRRRYDEARPALQRYAALLAGFRDVTARVLAGLHPEWSAAATDAGRAWSALARDAATFDEILAAEARLARVVSA
jgi:hypothetical protein